MAGDSEADEKRYGPLDRDIDHAERLREWVDLVPSLVGAGTGPVVIVMSEAADEIERLRAALRDLLDGCVALDREQSILPQQMRVAREALGDD